MATVSSGESTSFSASDALRAIASQDPERAVLELDSRRYTYAELDEASESLAHALVEMLGPGRHHVGLYLEGTWELLVSSMAIARAGLVSVPVDPTAPAVHLGRVCDEVGAALVLSDAAPPPSCPATIVEPLSLVRSRPSGWNDIPPGTYVSIAFTSGSTGAPKGIVIPPAQRPVGDGGVDNSVYGTFDTALRAGLIAGGSTNVVETAAQNFILLGATIVAYEIRRLGTASFGSWLRAAQVFGFTSVPTVLRHLLRTLDESDQIDSVRMLFVSGETVTWEDLALLRRHFPEAIVMCIFGTTETGPCLALAVDSGTAIGVGPIPLGFPMAGRTVEIVDEHDRPVAEGGVGEIVVTGRETSLGYWQRPAETEATFASVDTEQRRVRTGDLGRWLPDGSVAHHGRRDHVVKIAGNRVELGQVEAGLRSLKGVGDAAATTYVDSYGDTRLAACVVAASGFVLHPAALRVELARRLPGPMLPDGIEVVDRLPLLPGGKIDRSRLPVSRAGHVGPTEEPTTSLERELVALWRDVLGVHSVSIDDDFFLLGGDSLRGARLIVELNRRRGVDLPVSVLVEAPTIRRFAAVLESHESPWSPLVPVRSTGDDPVLLVVHDGTGEVVFAHPLARHLPESVPVYGLRGQGLDGKAIPQTTIEELAARYLEAVRTVRPAGPYLLYGMSVGGTIAFEMARQLRAAGESVPLLAVGDTPGPGGYHSNPAPPLAERAAARLTEIRRLPPGLAARRATALAARQIRSRAVQASEWIRREPARRAADVRRLVDAAAGGAPVPLELRKQFALHLYGMLAVQYTPESPYDGSITILRSRDGASAVQLWAPYVSGDVDITEIDGAHTEFGREPVVGEVGRVLASSIGAAIKSG